MVRHKEVRCKNKASSARRDWIRMDHNYPTSYPNNIPGGDPTYNTTNCRTNGCSAIAYVFFRSHKGEQSGLERVKRI